MNLDKSKLILKKINRLYDLVNEFGEASDTEKDLIKAYVIDLYGAVIEEGGEDIETEEMKKKIKKRKKLEKKLRKKDKIAKLVADEDVDLEEVEEKVSIENDPKPAAAPEPVAPVAVPVVEAAKVVSAAPVVHADAKGAVNFQLQELFKINNSGELSDRLSQSPVSDLTKAMGINEKILTVNELFGGNSDELNNMLIALNGLTSFDEAKNVLMRSVASKYDWASDSKVKKARQFIKLVQRKYN